MRVKELLQQGAATLINSESPQLDSELLLTHQLGKSRTWLHTWPDEPIMESDQAAFKALLSRRQQGEPIAHILGRQAFWSLDLAVTNETLIPRPETELLVETALERIPADQPWTIADLGTGSGAIALAIASERSAVTVIATDQSLQALKTAAQNAKQHQINQIEFRHGSWFRPLDGITFDLILSNPPYIAENDPHLSQGDVRFDPQSALTAGADGLDDLKQIIRSASQYLKPQGQLIVEHGYDQGNAVRSLFQQHHFTAIATRCDLSGQERITYGRHTKTVV